MTNADSLVNPWRPGVRTVHQPSATANAQGNYGIADVPAGSQTVRATASGFTARQQKVTQLPAAP